MSFEGKGAGPFTGRAIPVLQPAAPEQGFGDLAERCRALEYYAHRVSIWADQLVTMLEHHGLNARMMGIDQIRGDHVRRGEIGWPKLSLVKVAEVRITPNPLLFALTFARIENALATSGNMTQDLVVYGRRIGLAANVELGRATAQKAPLARIDPAGFLPELHPIIVSEDGKNAAGAAQKRYTLWHIRDDPQLEAESKGLPSRDGF